MNSVGIPIHLSAPGDDIMLDDSSYSRNLHTAMAIVGSLNDNLSRSLASTYAMQLLSPGSHNLASRFSPASIDLEDRFCRDFVCCGIHLATLHDLLQHFEESHVHVESDFQSDDDMEHGQDMMPFEFDSCDDMDTDMEEVFDHASAAFYPGFLETQSIALSEIYSQHQRMQQQRQLENASSPILSAFDTSIVRKHSTGSRSARAKRLTSVPQPPSFFLSQEPQTIPLAFDAPTKVISENEPEETSVSAPQSNSILPPMSFFPPPTMNVNPTRPAINASRDEGSHDNASGVQERITDRTLDLLSALSNGTLIIDDDKDDKDDRPYKCQVKGCSKAYKNPGGLKYHIQHGHCDDNASMEMNLHLTKPYQCTVPDCGKRYKNLNGLKYHIEHSHMSLLEKLQQ